MNLNSMNSKWIISDVSCEATSLEPDIVFTKINIDDIYCVHIIGIVIGIAQAGVIKSFYAGSTIVKRVIKIIDNEIACSKLISDFNAKSLEELIIKLELEGFIYDSPTLIK